MNKEFRRKNPATAKRFLSFAKEPFYSTLILYGLFGTPFMLAVNWFQDRPLFPSLGMWLLFLMCFSLVWAYVFTYAQLIDQESAYLKWVFGKYRELAEAEYGDLDREYTELWRHIQRDGRAPTDEDYQVARARKPDRILLKKALDAAERDFPGQYSKNWLIWDMGELQRGNFPLRVI